MAPRILVPVVLAAALLAVAPRLATSKDEAPTAIDAKAELSAMTWLAGWDSKTWRPTAWTFPATGTLSWSWRSS